MKLGGKHRCFWNQKAELKADEISSTELRCSPFCQFGRHEDDCYHPASTTHSKLFDEERNELESLPDWYVVPLVLENIDDILGDLKASFGLMESKN